MSRRKFEDWEVQRLVITILEHFLKSRFTFHISKMTIAIHLSTVNSLIELIKMQKIFEAQI